MPVVQFLPRSMQAGFTYHIGIAKPLLLELLRQHGATGILKGWDGTDAEAESVITADPRFIFVLDPTCDHQSASGECQGHPNRTAEQRPAGIT